MRQAFIIVALLSAVLFSEYRTKAQTPTPKTDTEDVVKITTKLVQVDVVVTDKKGNQVRELGVSDFELLQDGRAQKITGVTYVPIDSAAVTSPVRPAKPVNGVLPPPTKRMAGEGGRVIALVVDDGNCLASLWGINSAKDGLKRFITDQMLPNDYVAIYRTREGSSAAQQYTSDKAVLLKAVEKIRWYPPKLGCRDTGGSFSERATATRADGGGGVDSVGLESETERRNREYREDAVSKDQIVGTIGLLRYAINGLERAPGRKLMFVFSDVLPFRSRQNEVLSTREALRDLTDAANRAGVVVNTLSLRGADVPGMIEARDEVLVKEGSTDAISRSRMSENEKYKEGLSVLAYDTGGTFYQGADRLNLAVGDMLRREAGYYLIAYEPDENSFKDKKFNRIEVKTKIPDLKVAYRAGYVGVPDVETARAKRRHADSELYDAIISPLPRPGLNIGLSAHFVNRGGGDFVRSVFHLDGSSLVFTDEPNSQKKAVLDVVAVTMDEKNDVVDEFTRTHTLKFDSATADRIQLTGLVYSTDVPIKKPGSYTFRVAVRDANSKQIGSSSQVVQIPDLKKAGIFLSGVAVAGVDGAGKFQEMGPTTAETAIQLPASASIPAIRRFVRGSVIAYSYSIYNIRRDRSNVTLQVNLFKDEKLVAEGQPSPIKLDGVSAAGSITDFAYMRLTGTEPGDYALQITVRDLAAGKNAVSSQWIDFEVVD